MQGLLNNYNQVEVIASTENPDIFILTETHITKEVEENEITLQYYDHIASLSTSKRTGGVVIYFKKIWKVTKIIEKIDGVKYWILVCKATCQDNQMIIAAIYRSPSYGESEFCKNFEEVLEEISDYNCNILITGDFNIDWSKNSQYKNKMECTLNDNGLRQLVNEYTRVTKSSSTIIDFVITNNYDISVNNCNTNKISDHEMINILIRSENNDHNNIDNKEVESFKYNKETFNTELSKNMAYNENKNINENVILFDNGFKETIKTFTNKKIIQEKNNVNRWFNNEVRLMKKDKIIKYQTAKLKNTNQAWTNYKTKRNIYKVKIENEKNKYINNKINNADDQKQMWREIKDLVFKKNVTR